MKACYCSQSYKYIYIMYNLSGTTRLHFSAGNDENEKKESARLQEFRKKLQEKPPLGYN